MQKKPWRSTTSQYDDDDNDDNNDDDDKHDGETDCQTNNWTAA